ncbi:MAG: hypothetical protein LBH28_05585 [Oscillospiraceae bacterium]|jgi:predicted acetyltransferase|nr:hypothetical protein [Oscillospiraceae bacterium]
MNVLTPFLPGVGTSFISTVGTAFSIGTAGNLLDQLILGEEIDWGKTLTAGVFSALLSAVLFGVCFVAGTPVLTANGIVAIEDIKTGDLVCSEDRATGTMIMKTFILKEISAARSHVLDNMLQLYAHELNEYFDYSIIVDNDGRYRIKSAATYLDSGWGYFIVASCELAGFILLNRHTKAREGVFIEEFFILPRFRQGSFYKDVISRLLGSLNGMVEYRVLKKNKRALLLFSDLARRFLSDIQTIDEYEKGSEYLRFSFDTANITPRH